VGGDNIKTALGLDIRRPKRTIETIVNKIESFTEILKQRGEKRQ
jgi:hypothetical protein